ncbi:MAG: hypothetical protein RIS64_976 [Bacteroidota bacterium]|jgi:hypothetical protein
MICKIVWNVDFRFEISGCVFKNALRINTRRNPKSTFRNQGNVWNKDRFVKFNISIQIAAKNTPYLHCFIDLVSNHDLESVTPSIF